MRLFCIPALTLVALFAAAPVFAQCRLDAERRDEMLLAVRLINRALMRVGPDRMRPYPTWQELANSPVVPTLRGMGGPMGDVARKMRWGAAQPLPGWDIHFVAAGDAYAFSLTDRRDACGPTFSSNDTGAIVEGQEVGGQRFGVVPLDTRQ
jgi:hypothetical protein